jgi:hypothetical protein
MTAQELIRRLLEFDDNTEVLYIDHSNPRAEPHQIGIVERRETTYTRTDGTTFLEEQIILI